MSEYKIEDGMLIVPEGTTMIDMGKFQGNNEIERIMLPESIKLINPNAFLNCENLKAVWVPEWVHEIIYRAHNLNVTDFKPFSLLVRNLRNHGYQVEFREEGERDWRDWN